MLACLGAASSFGGTPSGTFEGWEIEQGVEPSSYAVINPVSTNLNIDSVVLACEEAEDRNDRERASRVRAEMDFIVAELAQAVSEYCDQLRARILARHPRAKQLPYETLEAFAERYGIERRIVEDASTPTVSR